VSDLPEVRFTRENAGFIALFGDSTEIAGLNPKFVALRERLKTITAQ